MSFIDSDSELFMKTKELMIEYKLYKLYYGDLPMEKYWNDAFYDDLYDFCNSGIKTCYRKVKDNKTSTYEYISGRLNLRFDNIIEKDIKLKERVQKFCNEITNYYLNYEKESPNCGDDAIYKDGFIIHNEDDWDEYHDWSLSVGLE